ncbi:MAG: tyrosine-type recombinase/integrase [Solirubrobacteraceae bacterium]
MTDADAQDFDPRRELPSSLPVERAEQLTAQERRQIAELLLYDLERLLLHARATWETLSVLAGLELSAVDRVQARAGPAHVGRGRPKAGFLTRVQAEIEGEKFRQSLMQDPTATADLLFVTVLDGYLDWCLSRPNRPLVEDTMRTYRQIAEELRELPLARDRRGKWKDATFEEIDELEIETYVRSLEKRRLAPSTLNQRRSVVSGIWNKYAKRRLKLRGLIDPRDCWEFNAVPDSEDYDVWTKEQVWAIARRMDSLQDAAIVLLCAFCGLRQSEVRGLRWQAVVFTSSLVYVHRKHTNAAEVDGLPKGKKAYAVPLPDQVAAVLSALKEQRGEPAGGARAFVGAAKGGTFDSAALRRRFQAAQEKEGLEPLRLHDLRHTFGTIAVEEWEDIDKVREFMGHKDVKTTRRYLHRRPKTEDAQRMTAAIGGDLDLGAVLAKPLSKTRRGGVGERNARSKLTEADVAAIRCRIERGGETQYALAREYGVSSATMNYVANYRTWPDVAPAAPEANAEEITLNPILDAFSMQK